MIIVATAIDSIRKLLPTENIYRGIKSQPFLRLYGKFSKCSIPIMKQYVKGYTIVPQPLQKIIPMNPDNGVYMIAYNDNKNSKQMSRKAQIVKGASKGSGDAFQKEPELSATVAKN